MMTVVRRDGGGYRVFAKGASEIISSRYISDIAGFSVVHYV